MELKIPQHIAFIMDGNGRWAKKRLLPRNMGHREGVRAMQRVVELCSEYGVKVVSFYAFSTENWSRPQDEIDGLFRMLKTFAEQEIPRYAERNFIVRFMGDLTRLPIDVQEALERNVRLCDDNSGTVVNIGINYGGRDEIVHACNKLISEGKQMVTAEDIEGALYTSGLPSPDLMVRSSGEVRLSNFMLWQLAYTEMIFRSELWPDFDREILHEILVEYSGRDRRFGKVK